MRFLGLCATFFLSSVWLVQTTGALIEGANPTAEAGSGWVSWFLLAGIALGAWTARLTKPVTTALHFRRAGAILICLAMVALSLGIALILLPDRALPALPIGGWVFRTSLVAFCAGMPGFLVGRAAFHSSCGESRSPGGQMASASVFLLSFCGLGFLYGSLLFWPSIQFPLLWGLPATLFVQSALSGGTGWFFLRRPGKPKASVGLQIESEVLEEPWPRLARWLERHQDKLVWAVGSLILIRTGFMLRLVWPFSTDDAYITLRYSRHLAEGAGLSWNAGELVHVEGYSNFLFVLLGALTQKMGLESILIFKCVSTVALFGTLYLLFRMAKLAATPLIATIPPLIFSAYEGSIWWSVSGMETIVYIFLSILAIYLFIVEISKLQNKNTLVSFRYFPFIGSGLCVLAASLTRPEGPIVGMTLGFGALYLWATDRLSFSISRQGLRDDPVVRALATLVASMVIPYVIYLGWKLFYFGRLWPNTYYWKKILSSNEPYSLVLDFLLLGWLPLVFTVILYIFKRSMLASMALFLAASYIFMLKGVDPIIGYYNRHFLIVITLLCITSVLGLFVVLNKIIINLRHSVLEAMVCLCVVIITSLTLLGLHKYLARESLNYSGRMAARRDLAYWLSSRIKPDEAFAIGDSGLVPFLVKARALDLYFLNSREMTSPPIMGSVSRYVDWMLVQSPKFIILPSTSPDRMDPWPLYGVNEKILEHPCFIKNYGYQACFGAKGDGIHYWVYQQKKSM